MSATNDPVRPPATATPPPTPAAASEKPKPQSPERFARLLFRIDVVLLALVLVLAFLLGSFAASNSDLFLHLGLANPFGRAARWPHHGWLPSLLLRIIYEPFSAGAEVGGGYAVALKALVVVAIAVVLLLIRRRGQSLVLPIVCTALVVLVMSPRLLLQPFVLSLLLLAVTLFLLTRPARVPPIALWCLPPLFALWVNLDHWFVLGPIMVALFLAGEWLEHYFKIPTAADSPQRQHTFKATSRVERSVEQSLREGIMDAPRAISVLISAGVPKATAQAHVAAIQADVAATEVVSKKTPERIKQLGMVLLAGLAACLVNPWLLRALTLPPELGYLVANTGNLLPGAVTGAGRMIHKIQHEDPQFQVMVSPFSSAYWRASTGLNAAGMAYFVLLLTGLASIYLVTLRPKTVPVARPRIPPSLPLCLVFVFFALLSITTQRLIPLFAVVAGPIAVLNLQDFARRLLPATAPLTPKQRNWMFTGRSVALLTCVLLLVCAWPGWLHTYADNWRLSHRVSWQVLEDPGILEAARTIALVQEQTGRMKLGLSYDLEGGNLLAWPAQHDNKAMRLLGDARYQMTTSDAEVYGKIRKALRDENEGLYSRPSDAGEERQIQEKIFKARKTYQELMVKQDIDYVVITGCHYGTSKSKQLADGLMHLPLLWTLLYHDGRTAIFGFRDPDPRKKPLESMKLDLAALVAPKGRPANLPRIGFDPQRVPPPPLGPPSDLVQFFKGPQDPSLFAFQAEQYRTLFDYEAKTIVPFYYVTSWLAAVGVAAPSALEMPRGGPEYTDEAGNKNRKVLQATFVGPAAAPLYSVRAARNAVLDRPNHLSSYVQVFAAYQLLYMQENRLAQRPLPNSLRLLCHRATITTALNNAATVQPHSPEIHRLLVDIFWDMQYFDLAVDHFVKFRQNIDEQKWLKEQLEMVDADLKKRGEFVKQKREEYKQNVTSEMDAVEKYELSLFGPGGKPPEQTGGKPGKYLGLAKQGLKLLLEAKADKLPPEQQKKLEYLRLLLLLTTGQAKEAQERLKVDLRDQLPDGTYEQMQAITAVALGDYLAADKYLTEAEKRMEKPPTQQIIELQKHLDDETARQRVAWLTQLPIGLHPMPAVRSALSDVIHSQLRGQLNLLAEKAVRVAEVRLLRGLLALQVGNTAAAGEHFRAVLAMAPASIVFPDRAIAQRYLELLE